MAVAQAELDVVALKLEGSEARIASGEADLEGSTDAPRRCDSYPIVVRMGENVGL